MDDDVDDWIHHSTCFPPHLPTLPNAQPGGMKGRRYDLTPASLTLFLPPSLTHFYTPSLPSSFSLLLIPTLPLSFPPSFPHSLFPSYTHSLNSSLPPPLTHSLIHLLTITSFIQEHIPNLTPHHTTPHHTPLRLTTSLNTT